MYGNIITEERYLADKVILRLRRYEESVKGSEKQALGEFLKLMDLNKAGVVTDFAIVCESKNGKIWRFKKSYTMPDVALNT